MVRLPVLVSMLALTGGCADLCSNEVIGRVDAPGGRKSAVLFNRDCGATTDFSSHVSILALGAKPEGGGNLLRADAGGRALKLGAWGGPWTELRWLAPDHLLIRHAAGMRVFRQGDQVDGVRVSYEAIAR